MPAATDSWELIANNYLTHQKKEGKFCNKFEDFLLDYKTLVSDLTAPKKKSNNYSQAPTLASTFDLVDDMFPPNNISNNFIEAQLEEIGQ